MKSLDERPPATEISTQEELPAVEVPPARVRVAFGAVTHPGKVRTNNEDHYLVAKLAKSMRICQSSLPETDSTRFSDEEAYWMIVADGMGGAAAGEMASAVAVWSVESFVLDTLKWFLHFGKEQSELVAELRQGLERADREVIERAQADGRLAGMGTTLTMAYSVSTDLYLVHAGDSRAYLFRDGQLEQMTHDHTFVQMLVDQGQLTPEAAKRHARRNIVTNVIGGPDLGVHAEIHKVRLADGDILLLCSDGLTEPVDDAAIAQVLAQNPDPKEACRLLLEAALARGAPDNVTLVVARYEIK